jgi:hypothetical protein
MQEIIAIERIEREARAAAVRYADLFDACPYPFHTDAGRAFRLCFLRARVEIEDARRAARRDGGGGGA